MDNPYGLRVAGPDDFDALLAFAMLIYQEDAAMPVSQHKVADIVGRCIARDRALAGIVTGPAGIEASVGASFDCFDYADEPHVMVKWLGVAPAFRHTDRAARCVSYVRWVGETMSALAGQPVPIFLSAMTTVEQKRKVSLYQRRAPQVGTLFAFGCLPERTFFIPGRVGTAKTSQGKASKVPPLVAHPPLTATG